MFDPLFLKKLRLTFFFVYSFCSVACIGFSLPHGVGCTVVLNDAEFSHKFYQLPPIAEFVEARVFKISKAPPKKNYWSTSYNSTQLAFCIEPSLVMASIRMCIEWKCNLPRQRMCFLGTDILYLLIRPYPLRCNIAVPPLCSTFKSPGFSFGWG